MRRAVVELHQVVERLHQETVKALESASVKDKLVGLGVEPMIMKPADFDARVAKETRISAELAKAAGIPVQ